MSNKFAFIVIASLCVGIALAPGRAIAATASASFNVSVTVQSACAASATSMNFGSYNGSLATGTSTISVNCTSSTPYNVGLSEGMAQGATVVSRKMIGPGSALPAYTLRSSSGGTANWGHTVGADTVSGPGSGSEQTLVVLGQIPAGQQVQDGVYGDTITVTVTY